MSYRLFAAAVTLAALLCACGGGSGRNVLEPTPVATVQPTLKPFVPEDQPTPGTPAGRVTTQINATCSLSVVDAVIKASFKANVVGPDATLRRVRLMLNNKLADDSGDVYVTSYEKAVELHVSSGSSYSLAVTYIATNAIGPQLLNVVRCPASPGAGA